MDNVDTSGMPEGFQLDQAAPAQATVPAAQAAPTTGNDQIPDGFQVDPDTNPAAAGYQMPAGFQLDDVKYGTPGQKIITGAEGAAQGFLGPLAPYLETKLGLATPQDIRARQNANSFVHGLSEAGAFGVGAFVGAPEAMAVTKLGEAAEAFAGLDKATTITGKLAAGAVRASAEMTAFQATDEASKAILQDPNQTMGSAVSNIGLSGLIGAVTGPVFSGVGMALNKVINDTSIKEFSDRLALRASTANPNEAMENEFNNAIQTYHDMNDEVLGPNGLKAQALSKLLPDELTPAIQTQIQDVANKGQEALTEMVKKDVSPRYINKLMNDLNSFQEVATNPQADVVTNFDALNNLKQTLQGYSKGNFGPFSIPSYHEAYDFLNITKSLGHDIRKGLENVDVWGDAAKLQKDLNASWSKILPAVKDVQSKFMEKVAGNPIPSSQKFATYTGQAGKATSQTIRQQMMGKFVDAMQNHFDTVGKIYEDAGVDNPFPAVGMGELKASLEKPSIGARAADLWYNKIGPEGMASIVGAAAGHAAFPGLGGFGGAYLGKELLGPAFSLMIKPALEKGVNSAAFKSSMALIKAVVSGEHNLTNATANLFAGAAKTLPSHLMPDNKDLDKLAEQVKSMKQDQARLFNQTNSVTHYLPDHGQAMSKTVANAVNYLAGLQPTPVKNAPLDDEIEPSQEQKSEFKRILAVAQQPLMALHYMKQNMLLPNDVNTLRALYPEYYTKMSQEIMTAMTKHISDGGKVPYDLRQGLSLFLGEAMDSTFTPASIQAAQSIYAPPPPVAPPMPTSQAKSKTGGLSKIADAYATPNQASVKRNQRSKA